MRKLLVGAIGGAALMQCGCAIVSDVKHAKADVKKAAEVWNEKVVPELKVVKEKLVQADTDITRNVQQAEELWTSTIQPDIAATKEFFTVLRHEVKADVQKTADLWRDDLKPRLQALEKAVTQVEQEIAKVVQAIEGDVQKVLAAWHTDFETHLHQLERIAGTAEADFQQFEQRYDRMKAGLRTVTTRVKDDVTHNAVVQHVESLVQHVETLSASHARGITQSAIEAARADVSAGVRKVMQLF